MIQLTELAFYLPIETIKKLDNAQIRALYGSTEVLPVYAYSDPSQTDDYEAQFKTLCKVMIGLLNDPFILPNDTELKENQTFFAQINDKRKNKYPQDISAFQANVFYLKNPNSMYRAQKDNPTFFPELKFYLEIILLKLLEEKSKIKTGQYNVNDKIHLLSTLKQIMDEALKCDEGVRSKLGNIKDTLTKAAGAPGYVSRKLDADFESMGNMHAQYVRNNIALDENDAALFIAIETHIPGFFKLLAKAKGKFPANMPFTQERFVPDIQNVNGKLTVKDTNAMYLNADDKESVFFNFDQILEQKFNAATIIDYIKNIIFDEIMKKYKDYRFANSKNNLKAAQTVLFDLGEFLQEFKQDRVIDLFDSYDIDKNEYQCKNEVQVNYASHVLACRSLTKEGMIKGLTATPIMMNKIQYQIMSDGQEQWIENNAGALMNLKEMLEDAPISDIKNLKQKITSFGLMNALCEETKNEFLESRNLLKTQYNARRIDYQKPFLVLENITDIEQLMTTALRTDKFPAFVHALEATSREKMQALFTKGLQDPKERAKTKRILDSMNANISLNYTGIFQTTEIYLSDAFIETLFNTDYPLDEIPSAWLGNPPAKIPRNFRDLKDRFTIEKAAGGELEKIFPLFEFYPKLITNYLTPKNKKSMNHHYDLIDAIERKIKNCKNASKKEALYTALRNHLMADMTSIPDLLDYVNHGVDVKFDDILENGCRHHPQNFTLDILIAHCDNEQYNSKHSKVMHHLIMGIKDENIRSEIIKKNIQHVKSFQMYHDLYVHIKNDKDLSPEFITKRNELRKKYYDKQWAARKEIFVANLSDIESIEDKTKIKSIERLSLANALADAWLGSDEDAKKASKIVDSMRVYSDAIQNPWAVKHPYYSELIKRLAVMSDSNKYLHRIPDACKSALTENKLLKIIKNHESFIKFYPHPNAKLLQVIPSLIVPYLKDAPKNNFRQLFETIFPIFSSIDMGEIENILKNVEKGLSDYTLSELASAYEACPQIDAIDKMFSRLVLRWISINQGDTDIQATGVEFFLGRQTKKVMKYLDIDNLLSILTRLPFQEALEISVDEIDAALSPEESKKVAALLVSKFEDWCKTDQIPFDHKNPIYQMLALKEYPRSAHGMDRSSPFIKGLFLIKFYPQQDHPNIIETYPYRSERGPKEDALAFFMLISRPHYYYADQANNVYIDLLTEPADSGKENIKRNIEGPSLFTSDKITAEDFDSNYSDPGKIGDAFKINDPLFAIRFQRLAQQKINEKNVLFISSLNNELKKMFMKKDADLLNITRYIPQNSDMNAAVQIMGHGSKLQLNYTDHLIHNSPIPFMLAMSYIDLRKTYHKLPMRNVQFTKLFNYIAENYELSDDLQKNVYVGFIKAYIGELVDFSLNPIPFYFKIRAEGEALKKTTQEILLDCGFDKPVAGNAQSASEFIVRSMINTKNFTAVLGSVHVSYWEEILKRLEILPSEESYSFDWLEKSDEVPGKMTKMYDHYCNPHRTFMQRFLKTDNDLNIPDTIKQIKIYATAKKLTANELNNVKQLFIDQFEKLYNHEIKPDDLSTQAIIHAVKK